MTDLPFRGGSYDGATFTFSDRPPARVHLGIDCLDVDVSDPDVQEAIRANLTPKERDELVVMPNARSFTAEYELDTDGEGAPYYRYVGWTVQGSRSDRS